MAKTGYMLLAFVVVFCSLAEYHAVHMFGIQGDPRWMLTIVGAPIFGLILAAQIVMMMRATK